MSLKIFNNLLVYRMTDAAAFHARKDELNELLAERPARLPGKSELSTEGFCEPLGIDDEYVEHVRAKTMVITVNFAQRMLPAKVVRQRLASAVREIEQKEERKVYAREKNQIKDKIISEMLPHAFIDQKIVRVMILGPYIAIDSTSAKTGELALSLMREVLGTLGVRPVTVKTTPIEPFTHWFTGGKLPAKFGLTGDFKANSNNDEIDSITGKGTSPETEGLSDLVAEYSRRVIVLGLHWESSVNERVYFTVNEMIGIKGIKWPDAIMDMANADAGEEAEQHNLVRATYLLLSAEIAQLITDLLDALGGEEIPGNSDWDEDHWTKALKALGNITHVNGEPVGQQGWTPPGPARIPSDLAGHEVDDDDAVEDALTIKVTAWVRETKRCSISAIQRKFTIGYNRAARIVERLEELGVITAMNSNGSREVIRVGSKVNDSVASLLEDLPDDEQEEEESVI